MDVPGAAKDRNEQVLITDAIVELTTSKRKIGLYPRDHPKIRESLQRAFSDLQSLLVFRGTITVGIAENMLMVDEVSLDMKNPALKDFARGLHTKGIAAVTFAPGLSVEELQRYHELMTERELPVGQGLAELTESRGISHIVLTPLDISKFSFVEDALREDLSPDKLWEEYVRRLLEGSLVDGDLNDRIAELPPEELASFLNRQTDETTLDTLLDGVMKHYFRMGRGRGMQELLSRLLVLIDSLTPEVRELFIEKALKSPLLDYWEIHRVMRGLHSDTVERMMKLFQSHASQLPENLRYLIEKLNASRAPAISVIPDRGTACVDDVEVDPDAIRKFSEDPSACAVDADYAALLEKMKTDEHAAGKSSLGQKIQEECRGNAVDLLATDIMFELLNVKSGTREEYLAILTRLADFMRHYIDTGRYQEISAIYGKIHEDSLTGTFREEASRMKRTIFGSEDFIRRLIESFKVWGRLDREKVQGLTALLKEYLQDPLLDALALEPDAMIRRFFLDVLVVIGPDLPGRAVQKLNDERWYVIRNMVYLIRECGGVQYVQNIRHLAKHPDRRISSEAVRTLVHFNTTDSVSYIRHYLTGKDLQQQDQAVRLAGQYKVVAAVPYLVEILDRKDYSAGLDHNAAVIKALAEIGDPSAVPVLLRICQSSSLFHRADLDALKLEIYRNLSFYSTDAVRPLLEQGAVSKNVEIRMISQRLLLRRKTDGK
ncbi:MAG: hypothetical protein WA610_11675 [Thermodesulfovibrionales bacterium]